MQHRFGFLTSFTILSVSPVLCLSVMRDCLFSPWSEMPIVSLAAFSCRFQIRPANTVSLAELKRNRWPLANCKRTIGCHESRIAQPWLESMSMYVHSITIYQPNNRIQVHDYRTMNDSWEKPFNWNVKMNFVRFDGWPVQKHTQTIELQMAYNFYSLLKLHRRNSTNNFHCWIDGHSVATNGAPCRCKFTKMF